METKRMQNVIILTLTILLTFISPLLLCAVEEGVIDSVVPFVPGKTASLAGEDLPFGLMDPFTSRSDLMGYLNSSREDYREKYLAWVNGHLQNMGSKWSKVATEHMGWGLIEPVLGNGYQWDNLDDALKDVFQSGEQNFIGVIVPNTPSREQYDFADPFVQKHFRNFIRAIVERYDGDNDFDNAISVPDSSIKIKYWQADNEPFKGRWIADGGTTATYATFLKLLSEGAKEADPEAKIVFGSQILVPESIDKNDYSNIEEVISILKDKNIFDFADVHYWPMNKNEYQMPVSDLRKILDDNGYEYVRFVSLEHATIMNKDNQNPIWVNSSRGGELSEKDQAAFLIKSYAYNLANGFSLMLWSPFVDFSNYGGGTPCDSVFDYMGLISDGKCINADDAGIPRLSYYTYKKMTETLEGSDWNNIQTIQESDGIYIYKFIKDGVPIYVAWNDNTAEKQITISGITTNHIQITEAIPHYDLGEEVTDYTNAFNISESKYIPGEEVNLTLNDVPVFIEELPELTDTTSPVAPIVIDEGTYTVTTTQLYCSWESNDPESGIAEYQYKISEGSPEGTAIRDWTSTGEYNFVTAGALSLVNGKIYDFLVKAKNGAGLWSEAGYSDGITVDIIPPLTTDSGINDLWHNQPVTVTLTATDSVSGVDKTYYSTDGSNPTLLYAGPFTLSNDGIYTLKYYSQDKAGNIETLKTVPYQVKIDKTAPTGTIKINNDAVYTASTLVSLNLSATDIISGVSQMVYFSFDSASWLTTPQPYATTKSWTLTSNNGTKTVYAKFKDAAGNWSQVYSDTIILDTTPPNKPSVSDEGQFTVKSSQLYAQWESSDPESGIAEYQYRITRDSAAGAVVRDWTSTGTSTYVTAGALNLENGKTYYFAVKAINGAGLESEIGYSDGITVDIIPPLTTDSGINDLWHNQPVTVTFTATDSVSGVDKTYYSTDGTGPSILYSGPFTLSSDGVYTVKYYSVDKAGNTEAIKTASNQLRVDITLPSAPGMPALSSGSNPNNTGTYTISWAASTDTGSGLKNYDVYRNGTKILIELTSNAYDETNLTGETYTYVIYARDNAGNLSSPSAASVAIVVDKTAPTGTIKINNGAVMTNSTSVMLNLFAEDNTGGSGINQMRFSNDNITWSAPQAYATSKSWSLTSGQGTKTVYAKFKDAAGNWSQVYSDTIILDTTSPTITNISDSPDPFDPEPWQSSKISYVLSDNLSSPLYVYVLIFNSSGSLVNAILATQSLGSRYLFWNGRNFKGVYVPDGIYKYRILTQDMAGNYVYSGYYYVTKK